MKKIFTILLFCLLHADLFSQNIIDRKVNFEYIRLPLEPIKKSVKNYQVLIIPEYESEVKAKKEAFAKSVEDNNNKYAADMADYDKKVKDAGVKYAQDMAAHKVNQKTQPGLAEPVLVLPEKPEKTILTDKNYYPKPINPELLSTNYIYLDGYKKLAENAVAINILLKGLQYTEPELKISEVTKKNKDGVPYQEKEYYYELSYRYPMGLKMQLPGGEIFFYEYFEDLNRYTTHKTQKYKTELELMQAFNRDAFLNSIVDNLITANLQYINTLINNRFGLARIKTVEVISLVDGKKYSYTDYQQAFENVILGFNQLSADVNRTVAAQNINAGVSIWENALKESQPQNKKARINGNVTIATLFNIAIVSIYANEFVKAEIYLNKVLSSDASKKEQRRVEQIKIFLKDQQSRYEAFQKI